MAFFKDLSVAALSRYLALPRAPSSSLPAPSAGTPPKSYGATATAAATSVTPPAEPPVASSSKRPSQERAPSGQSQHSSPPTAKREPYIIPTEEDDDDDWDSPLRQSSYSHLLLVYTIVPLSSLLFFIFMLSLLYLIWPPPVHHIPIIDVLTAAAAWTLSYSLRIPLYSLCTLCGCYTNDFSLSLSTVVQVLAEESLRLVTFVVLNLHLQPKQPFPEPEDPAFARVWWIAVGWAAAECGVGIVQGYGQLALYKDVMGDRTPLMERPSPPAFAPGPSATASSVSFSPSSPRQEIVDAELLLDEEISHLITIKHRAELEGVYGVPVPNIPVFVTCLQRIAAILLSLSLTLFLSASYLLSLASITPLPTDQRLPDEDREISTALRHTLPALALVTAIHAALALLWTPQALPRIGVHTASYTTLMVALALFFAGLAEWGALD